MPVRSRQLLPDSLSEPPLEHGTIDPIARRPQDETSWGRFFWVMLRCETKDSSPACKKARIRPITGTCLQATVTERACLDEIPANAGVRRGSDGQGVRKDCPRG